MADAVASRPLHDLESETEDTVRVVPHYATRSTTTAGESTPLPAGSRSE